MIRRLTIANFRGLGHVVLDDLRSVNLLVGGNNTGKTSVLEALVLLLGDGRTVGSLPSTFRSNVSGGVKARDPDDRELFWSWLFRERDPEHQMAMEALLDSGQSLTLVQKRAQVTEGPKDIHWSLVRSYPDQPQGPIPVLEPAGTREARVLLLGTRDFGAGGGDSPSGLRLAVLPAGRTSPVDDAENYNHVALLAAGEDRVERIMRELEPRLKRLRYAKLPGTSAPLIYADIGLPRAVAATQMGEAFNRLLHIYTKVLARQINVLLVDEIENGIFSESLLTVWRGLLAICEQDQVQVFATTHSRECVMAAHAAAAERDKDELCVQRLQIVEGAVEAVRLGQEHLQVAADMGLEVRS